MAISLPERAARRVPRGFGRSLEPGRERPVDRIARLAEDGGVFALRLPLYRSGDRGLGLR
ncbi:hypothetical protein LP52_00690 [Streptomonospora alba]|uniref:Uncharacterized protein n=1 Tax=Streptomonospora alba TaxID=183763 RepID=A0A0C2JNM5_9ACTN|nr:hypothetical protein [Streptomonospora alba]KII00536.1 hypothetical protein LP52_00690 [Streptomonospora alba]